MGEVYRGLDPLWGGGSLETLWKEARIRLLVAVTPEIQEAARQVESFSRLLADCFALVGADREAID
jgi:hypothetical protein